MELICDKFSCCVQFVLTFYFRAVCWLAFEKIVQLYNSHQRLSHGDDQT